MKTAHAILLVEDNPADVKITQRALRDSGLPVDLLVVRDGQEAVEYLLRQGAYAASADWRVPDLILLDLNLPRLTGRQVLERIRATPDLRADAGRRADHVAPPGGRAADVRGRRQHLHREAAGLQPLRPGAADHPALLAGHRPAAAFAVNRSQVRGQSARRSSPVADC